MQAPSEPPRAPQGGPGYETPEAPCPASSPMAHTRLAALRRERSAHEGTPSDPDLRHPSGRDRATERLRVLAIDSAKAKPVACAPRSRRALLGAARRSEALRTEETPASPAPSQQRDQRLSTASRGPGRGAAPRGSRLPVDVWSVRR